MAIFNVARVGELSRGRAMALDPPKWAFLRVGPPIIVALRSINFRGAAKLAADPSDMVLNASLRPEN